MLWKMRGNIYFYPKSLKNPQNLMHSNNGL